MQFWVYRTPGLFPLHSLSLSKLFHPVSTITAPGRMPFTYNICLKGLYGSKVNATENKGPENFSYNKSSQQKCREKVTLVFLMFPGACDELKSPSSRLITGRLVGVGTGAFDLVLPANKC